MSEKMVRKAVGAVIFQNEEYLLVRKVKVMNGVNGSEDIAGHWDFPKGGVNASDESMEMALFRELKEETGSESYRIIKEFNKKICFEFPETHKYDCQETIMFLVEYLGDRTDLKSQDAEISMVEFFSKVEILNIICLEETIKFIREVL
jgi:putative (di)nucleoside polyphosphate hydrolase